MKERNLFKINGFIGIVLLLLVGAVALFGFRQFIFTGNFLFLFITGLCALILLLLLSGFTIIQPNQAKVFTLFGSYLGVIKQEGFWLTIPLTIRKTVSLRVINFNSDKLKVNDLEGNPIEIAAVVVYKVVDSAKAVFDVENYKDFVHTQSETGLRHIASQYPYDNMSNDYEISLRQHSDEVAEELTKDLQKRLELAGVEVIEARIMHLAYSSEIAHAMLQRQQARAVLAARKVIVDGAVSMVKSAIDQLSKEGIVELDEEKKAQMVNNLMVSIVSEKGSQPVINTGTIY
ncbi:SPFH domain-containing protein [Neobacillus thermocopriae]|uniref:SPFH domain-containing protein n=1 Tax=Neobacillus thermocopriae TaxID=1215031 RepID=A0A6B3TT84_9BACI|nr:SPFH domain-containing protein [Neobacillus thermocopriae]MED3622913.1 SPFH domain-containing protein [Neobacillus thermocopriae]MED3713187.1 SPFH domain-containing protein [Neobacillus thermocopriae]NEX79211.1 SPFH domain-containing protein [Neobacillus thermocopriae]